MNKKQIILVVISLLIGFAIGKLIFSGSSSFNTDQHQNETIEEHWTCSMHPQIDMPTFGQCPICGMDLIPKEKNNGEETALNSFLMSKNAMALANIQTLVVGEKLMNMSEGNSISLSGKIKANDKASAIQTAHFGGRLERLKYKSVGEYVSKGSLIATVYSPELVTAQNEFIEALDIKNEQPELFLAVRNKLKNWKISEKQIQQIENDKKVITNFNMYANVSGYIDEILVEEGNHVKEGSPLFKVSNLASVWAVFDVYEQDIKQFKKGQQLIIKVNAYPEKEFEAKIDFINPILNTKTRTVEVRATLSNAKKLLKPGMLLRSRVLLSKKNNSVNKQSSIEIPKKAVMWTGKRSIVYVKTDKNKPVFELREIDLGNRVGDSYQVLKGIKNGDEIVVNGTFTVDATAQLQGKRSMMNTSIKYKESNKNEEQGKLIERIEVSSKFKSQLNAVFKDYFKIKDAFVLTDAKNVNEKSTQMLLDLEKIKMGLLKKAEAHKIWMDQLSIIKPTLEKLQTEINIEKQRIAFIDLSNAMIVLANTFGVENTIYVQHCPMADDNKGADWLSFEKEIRNPYFGDKMLQCGSVEQIIEK
jgi:Cu(I)/Ag(I) efflux system membrane fusion protein